MLYVFGQQNGRNRNEDIIAFQALHDAYPFGHQSLVFVVNGVPPDRDRTYGADGIKQLMAENKRQTDEFKQEKHKHQQEIQVRSNGFTSYNSAVNINTLGIVVTGIEGINIPKQIWNSKKMNTIMALLIR
ncbi:unnamed protein product, partial [Didymodactylos carnosus]